MSSIDDDIVQLNGKTEQKSIPSGRIDNWWAGTHAHRREKNISLFIESSYKKKKDRHVSLHFSIRHQRRSGEQKDNSCYGSSTIQTLDWFTYRKCWYKLILIVYESIA